MSKVFIEETTLSAIGDAIREKGGTTALIAPLDMPDAITNLPTGTQVIPDEAFQNNYPNNMYRFYSGNGTWLWEEYADRFQVLSLDAGMFGDCRLIEEIPITLKSNSPYGDGLTRAFYCCNSLKEITNFEVSDVYGYEYTPTDEMFYCCYYLRTIPENILGTNYKDISTVSGKSNRQAMFENCYSLRKLPDLKALNDSSDTASHSIYYQMVYKCYCLDEATNLPVSSGTYDSNMFVSTFNHAMRLKDITFVTDNGVAKTANWKNQTINLASYTGYCSDTRDITDWNGGCSGLVNGDNNYRTYKDTADWYSNDYRYSRYNKTSLINTINTLPDTSAYLASNGGTNSIKLKSGAGSYTDGGSVDNLSAEQIAVASAKGWTIAYVEYEQ